MPIQWSIYSSISLLKDEPFVWYHNTSKYDKPTIAQPELKRSRQHLGEKRAFTLEAAPKTIDEVARLIIKQQKNHEDYMLHRRILPAPHLIYSE